MDAATTAGRARLDPSADVDPLAVIGDDSIVGPLTQVRERARVGRGCVIGRGAYIGPGVVVGDRCRIQDQALIYEPALLEEGAYVGPGVVLTNDLFPRAVTGLGTSRSVHEWDEVGVLVRTGASIGARAVCVAPVTIGRWAMVAAGAVVTRDVPDYALVAGVSARRVQWVGEAGVPLEDLGRGRFRCPRTGQGFRQVSGELVKDR